MHHIHFYEFIFISTFSITRQILFGFTGQFLYRINGIVEFRPSLCHYSENIHLFINQIDSKSVQIITLLDQRLRQDFAVKFLDSFHFASELLDILSNIIRLITFQLNFVNNNSIIRILIVTPVSRNRINIHIRRAICIRNPVHPDLGIHRSRINCYAAVAFYEPVNTLANSWWTILWNSELKRSVSNDSCTSLSAGSLSLVILMPGMSRIETEVARKKTRTF